MPTDVTDAAAGRLELDPALIDHSGDPERKHDESYHETENPPIYEGKAVEQAVYLDDELPTAEELHTLRRVPDKIELKVWTIAYVEMVERMSYYGATAVFVNFLQQPAPTPTGAALHPNSAQAQPGGLGLGQQTSTGLTTFNSFFNYTMPLFGAFVADTYLGRFRTIWIAVCIAILGHIILTVSAIPSVMAHPNSAVGCFTVGILVMGVGTGGFKPNVSPLIAEQVKWHKLQVKTLASGERVIVDPSVTTSRIYNWFYLFINVGALIGQIGMSYAERYVGFYLAYLIPTCTHITSLFVLFACKKFYNMRPPEGSVFAPAIKLLIRGTKGRWHANPYATYKHMSDGTFWEDLKPSKTTNPPAWYNFDDAWVDEVRRGWNACQVFLWLPFWWLSYGQLTNNLTSQAATMSLHGVPNDVVSNLDPLALIIFIPIVDLFIFPALRKANIRFTPIKKIFTGFMLGCAAMIWAAVMQYYIYKTSPCGWHASDPKCDPSPINVWAQTGSYVLIAFSEIFASIVSLEYGFSKAPKNMRSFVAAFALFMNALSSALSEAFLPLLVDPLVVWNYGAVAIIAFVVGIAFYWFNLNLDREDDTLNQLPTGHMGTQAQAEDIERRISIAAERKSSAGLAEKETH